MYARRTALGATALALGLAGPSTAVIDDRPVGLDCYFSAQWNPLTGGTRWRIQAGPYVAKTVLSGTADPNLGITCTVTLRELTVDDRGTSDESDDVTTLGPVVWTFTATSQIVAGAAVILPTFEEGPRDGLATGYCQVVTWTDRGDGSAQADRRCHGWVPENMP